MRGPCCALRKIMNVVYLFNFSFLVLVARVHSRVGVLKQNVDFYTNKWKVHITGGREKVEEIIKNEGFEIEREIEGLRNVYILKHPRHPCSGSYANEPLTERFRKYKAVLWVEQGAAVSRKTRRTVDINRLTCPREEGSNAASNYGGFFTDPYFPAQWTLHDCRRKSADGPQYDLNVMRVWVQYGYFGKDVVIIVIDDGLETDHVDLKNNYDPHFGLDLIDNDNKPDPVHTMFRTWSHGTRCTGQIAMEANNSVCGVGLIPLGTVGAVRLLGPKKSSDENDGTALLFRYQEVWVVSNSWGPNDDGQTMAHCGKITEAALKTASTEGLNGKGVVFVFAAGNGKESFDNCSCDPFVSSIYTIPVASADMNGLVTDYSERCPSIFITAYSGDGTSIFNVATTDVGKDKCTISHTGTSASAPPVAAAVGMAREANPNLTARDIQHLFPYSGEVAPLEDNPGTWVRGVTGFYYSLDFGFGMIDVFKFVTLARTFKSVPPVSACVIKINLTKNEPVERLKGYRKEFSTTGCKGLPSEVNFLEHVQVYTTVKYSKRGDLQVSLKSAAGTSIRILEPRPKDTNPYGIHNWAFDSVHAWGEPVQGTWEIKIFDQTGSFNNEGQVQQLVFVFHGTRDMPEHYKQRRTYYEFKLPPEKSGHQSGKNSKR